MEPIQEIIINVQEIEPKYRHNTIFETFDKLKEGEYLIIHNNHDPQPVYYQLQQIRGEVFKWEYLQQGPEWWDIKLSKKYLHEHNIPITIIDNDFVINVPEIEPRLKHATIFQVFDSLAPGESLIIHNDHDPKPVYYQLLSERGDIFTWEYLEQGPQWWDIQVTIKGEDEKETIGQIAAKDLRKAEVFKKHGIDFCCGGKKTVKQACEEKGIDVIKLEQELLQAATTVTHGNANYNDWNIDFLADFIVNTHHNYVRKYLPEIKAYATKVAQVHGANHPELKSILENVLEMSEDLTEHIEYEEKQLFPLIKKIANAKTNDVPYTPQANEKFEIVVKDAENEHEAVGQQLVEIRTLSKDYATPEDACASYKLLYKMLDEFENDLHIHIHLENNILFPKTIEIEKSLA